VLIEAGGFYSRKYGKFSPKNVTNFNKYSLTRKIYIITKIGENIFRNIEDTCTQYQQ